MTTAAETPLVTLEAIREAANRLRGVIVRTPLLPFAAPLPAEPARPRPYLKPENLQPIGAFKLRGAYNAIATLTGERRAAGVVTHSSGNHAQGVARAARLFGIRAVVVMPADAPRVKIRAVEADGAEIVFVGTSNAERVARAHAIAQQDGLALVPSYDDPAIIAGQGTAGLEIVEQVAELDRLGQDPGLPPSAGLTVLVPVGGGGLAAGVATAVKELRPDARVFGVEPSLAADAQASLREGRIVRWPPEAVGRTSADGMRTEALGDLPFRHLRRYLDGVVTVEEEAIARAMARAADLARLVLEPSGATSLAAWLTHEQELQAEGRVVCLLSGGNVDPARYRKLTDLGRAAGA